MLCVTVLFLFSHTVFSGMATGYQRLCISCYSGRAPADRQRRR